MNDKTMGLMLGAIGAVAFNLGFSAGKHPDIMSKDDDVQYIEVHFSDGKMYKVYEDFDEFMSRVRNSRR